MYKFSVTIDGTTYTFEAPTSGTAVDYAVAKCASSGWEPWEVTLPDERPITLHQFREMLRAAYRERKELGLG